MKYEWDGNEDWNGKVFEGDFVVKEGIKSLKGCPKVIKGNFICKNGKFKNLIGAPKVIEGNCSFEKCDNLKTLEGCPEKVDEMLQIKYCNNLITTKGISKDVNSVNLAGCMGLKKLEDMPKQIKKVLNLSPSGLTSLERCPEKVEKLRVARLGIKNFKGAPKYCEIIMASELNIEKFGSLEKVDLFNLRDSKIETFIDFPKKVKSLVLDGCKINKFDGIQGCEIEEIHLDGAKINDISALLFLKNKPRLISSDLKDEIDRFYEKWEALDKTGMRLKLAHHILKNREALKKIFIS